MVLLIVLVRVQDSRCMGPGSVSWDFTIPVGVRLLVVLLVVVWPLVSDMLIYDDFLDVYMFCMLHVLYKENASPRGVANPNREKTYLRHFGRHLC
jgi:hypothetical protein